MERYIGMDVHAASCTLAVISQTGKRLKDFPVETNGQALVEAVRMIPGQKHLVFEEGLQSAWLYETLRPHVDEIVVAGITESRGPKSDKRDAYGLAEKLRVGSLDKAVFKAPRQFTRLRELSRIHMTLVGDVVRVQARIKSLYRSRGVLVTGLDVYSPRRRQEWQKQLCSSALTRATPLPHEAAVLELLRAGHRDSLELGLGPDGRWKLDQGARSPDERALPPAQSRLEEHLQGRRDDGHPPAQQGSHPCALPAAPRRRHEADAREAEPGAHDRSDGAADVEGRGGV